MSNSSLTDYTLISPFKNSPRRDAIKKITIHHMAGDLTVEQCGKLFSQPGRSVSSNYGIGSDGRVGLYVDEADRSWCTASGENDHQAVTIEVANCSGDPKWEVSDKAMAKLIELCADICMRNGIPRLDYTGDKSGNLTMHRWFTPTLCPGPYLAGRFPDIADAVNRRLGGADETREKVWKVQIGAFKKRENADAQARSAELAGFQSAVILGIDGFGDAIYRVQIGAFKNYDNAKALCAKANGKGIAAILRGVEI